MKVVITRTSVAAGDDCFAPHRRDIDVSDESSIEEIVKLIVDSDYLPSICGGKATWSVQSKKILAVVAQQWKRPKMISNIELLYELEDLDYSDSVLRIHFNYHAGTKPDIVFNVLEEIDQCVDINNAS